VFLRDSVLDSPSIELQTFHWLARHPTCSRITVVTEAKETEDLHIHDRSAESVPQTSCSDEARQFHAPSLCFQGISYLRPKGRWNVEVCPIASGGISSVSETENQADE
jgi:hypothetical protein